ncbi:phage tail assembly chaperone family protein, TAC (plasmid) [Pantoea agglomerans]|uniref:phage tail assembly chaperone family protein, TAC n=1 Tax=Enterobacter agglomerans TaxID=549 RepID=UPI001F2B4E13|nr:phage tail assembly chaperone family protein, TAC [Pantoea agglomerans]UIL54737.1 phage tail assembly chaperone family protein, TAC [Pantoea agglomerans]
MKLTLDTLKTAGAFTGRPVEKEITWKQGDKEFTATVYVRPMGYHTATSDVLAMGGKVDGVAGRIAASICDEDGKPVFTPADITGEADPERGSLDGALTIALLVAIQEVNDLGKTSSSAPKTNSGASSSSTVSAAAPSQRRVRRLPSKSRNSGQNTGSATEA